MVVLFIPSIGIFLSPLFECNNSRLKAMANHIGLKALANRLVLEQLPASSLCIKQCDGTVALGSFLSKINQVHHITVSNCFGGNKIPSPSFVCHHVPKNDMFLIPEKWQSNVVINNMMSKLEILQLEMLDHLKKYQSHHLINWDQNNLKIILTIFSQK